VNEIESRGRVASTDEDVVAAIATRERGERLAIENVPRRDLAAELGRDVMTVVSSNEAPPCGEPGRLQRLDEIDMTPDASLTRPFRFDPRAAA
jgi:hypothetical protein